MTINAAYRTGGVPILLTDYLAKRSTGAQHIQIPTVEEATAKDTIVALVRKARLALSSPIWLSRAPDGNAIETVFRRLLQFATPTLTLAE